MYSLTLENESMNRVELTHNVNYSIIEIDGLYPPSSTINTSEISLYDGARFTSSKVDMRQLEIQIAIERDAERNRIALYRVIKTKKYIKIYYQNGVRDVYIEGYISDMNIDYFANKQTVTISILCPEPYFKDAQEIIDGISSIIDNFTFPFAITATEKIPLGYYDDILELNAINEGDVACGMIIEILASGEVINPAIFNRETTEFIRLKTMLQRGDVVYINTAQGQKSVQLLRAGKYINLFNSIDQGSTWLQLEPGDNVFTYQADGESSVTYMEVRFIHQHLYEGV